MIFYQITKRNKNRNNEGKNCNCQLCDGLLTTNDKTNGEYESACIICLEDPMNQVYTSFAVTLVNILEEEKNQYDKKKKKHNKDRVRLHCRVKKLR